jgi:TRAP-type C4-dicarboxylate transport system permease small subunit
MQTYRVLLGALARVLRVIVTLLMAALIVPVTMQILSRYTGIVPRYIWTEEIARLCFVWIVMIGAMIAVRDWSHFEVDLLPRSRNPHLAFLLRLIPLLGVALVAATFIIYGWDFAQLGLRQRSEISSLPMIWIYGIWPAAGLIWSLFLIDEFVKLFSLYRTERAREAG